MTEEEEEKHFGYNCPIVTRVHNGNVWVIWVILMEWNSSQSQCNGTHYIIIFVIFGYIEMPYLAFEIFSIDCCMYVNLNSQSKHGKA